MLAGFISFKYKELKWQCLLIYFKTLMIIKPSNIIIKEKIN